jgi:hypothetical protein
MEQKCITTTWPANSTGDQVWLYRPTHINGVTHASTLMRGSIQGSHPNQRCVQNSVTLYNEDDGSTPGEQQRKTQPTRNESWMTPRLEVLGPA